MHWLTVIRYGFSSQQAKDHSADRKLKFNTSTDRWKAHSVPETIDTQTYTCWNHSVLSLSTLKYMFGNQLSKTVMFQQNCGNCGKNILFGIYTHTCSYPGAPFSEVWLMYTCVCVQIQSFTRGRSVRKRREKLRAEGRAQSVPRDDMLPSKVERKGHTCMRTHTLT